MSVIARHGGHGHPSEDSVRQHALASLYWYVLATVLALGLAARIISAVMARQRIMRRESRTNARSQDSVLERLLEGARVKSASLLYRQHPVWLAALPLKRVFVIAIYAGFVAFLVTWKAIKHDDNFYERLGFRTAWISTTQTSLPFLLAARLNPIGLVLGTSYERINWFHRWASRVLIATSTVHGAFFVAEWLGAGFFWTELKTVGMVKWGIAAWLVLIWTLFSTIRPVRRLKYEFFVAQHILSVVLFLGFLVLHVPDHHHFSVWCAVVAFLYDVVARSANPMWRNLRLRLPNSVYGQASRYAHYATANTIDRDLTVLTIKNVGFSWIPGQHVLIWTPSLWREFPHPFTISSIPDTERSGQDIILTLKTKTGLTKKLNDWARQSEQSGDDGSLRLLLAGPYGSLPNWRQFDSLLFIASSTGGSFTTPVLEDLITSQSPGCVRKIDAIYIVRRAAHVEPYLKRVSSVISRAKSMGISVKVTVAVTQTSQQEIGLPINQANESRERLIHSDPQPDDGRESLELSRLSVESSRSSSGGRSDQLLKEEMDLALGDGYTHNNSFVTESTGRPDIAAYMRNAIGSMPGNICVAVCGGKTIERVVQTTVASLRRERVKEGLGGHDIRVHVERSVI
ncbi:hypothetical protein G7046_g7983 [Stylonectria norvegica]|nr:hypothetical protein G7046_g7983 [Stylonectria norvegica]